MSIRVLAVLVGVVLIAVPSARGGGSGDGPSLLRSSWTERQAELVETIPITRRAGARRTSVLTVPLPPLKRGDSLRFAGEVTATTTCVEGIERCIGRPYAFDPRIRSVIVLADGPRDAGPGTTTPISARAAVTCEQRRPNRNHHCPLVIEGRLRIPRTGVLPCRPASCHLNMLLAAHHRKREGGEVIVVGADRPDGSVDGGKARLSFALTRKRAEVKRKRMATGRQRVRRLPPGGAPRAVLSQRLPKLKRGDVLLASAFQRTAIRELPYFVAAKVILATRPGARKPSAHAREIVSRAGTATETNGFNCTVGPSAFRTPCKTEKAGIAVIKRTPRRPLYANLVMRSFPKRAQARGGFPPARVSGRGRLEVTRLRLDD